MQVASQIGVATNLLSAPAPFSPERRRLFEVLDGLRGIAAGAVLFGHATAIIVGHALFAHKYLAVQFFFMLSGFVVSYAYENRLQAGMRITEFYVRRAIRLYPLIIAGTVMGTLFLARADGHFVSDSFRFIAPIFSALAIPFPYTTYSFGHFPINPPEWSLFYELIAYFLFGALIKRSNTTRLIVVATISLALSVTVSSLYAGVDAPFGSDIFTAAFSFCVGILLLHWYAHGLTFPFKVPFSLLALVLLVVCVTFPRFFVFQGTAFMLPVFSVVEF